MPVYFKKYIFTVCIFLLNFFSIHAADTFYKIIKEDDWIKCKGIGYKINLPVTGTFISLLTWEQILDDADRNFPGQQKLLLLQLQISNHDTLFKWETQPPCEEFLPRYYGQMPRNYIKEIYHLRRDKRGNYILPKALLKQKKKSIFMPGALVSKVLHYQNWQNKKRLYKIQQDNFVLPKVRLQWWYFDFFLEDSSTIVLAFIPQKWWDTQVKDKDREALFMISQRMKDGQVKSFSANFKPDEILSSTDKLEIPYKLLIQSVGNKEARTYTIQLNFPFLQGVFNIIPTQAPFAPFPTGVMPGYLQTLISGAPRGVPSFSYVSQVPEGNLTGTLKWESYDSKIAGHAYHEQGRLDDTPEKQGSSWSWYHFSAKGWNIFGSPGTLIFIQENNKVSRSGFHLVSGDYGIRNRTFTNPAHQKIITGGEIYFRHKDLNFKLNMHASTSKALITYLSPDPNQVWATVEGAAKLSVKEGDQEKVIEGRMLLETCSWAESRIP